MNMRLPSFLNECAPEVHQVSSEGSPEILLAHVNFFVQNHIYV